MLSLYLNINAIEELHKIANNKDNKIPTPININTNSIYILTYFIVNKKKKPGFYTRLCDYSFI